MLLLVSHYSLLEVWQQISGVILKPEGSVIQTASMNSLLMNTSQRDDCKALTLLSDQVDRLPLRNTDETRINISYHWFARWRQFRHI